MHRCGARQVQGLFMPGALALENVHAQGLLGPGLQVQTQGRRRWVLAAGQRARRKHRDATRLRGPLQAAQVLGLGMKREPPNAQHAGAVQHLFHCPGGIGFGGGLQAQQLFGLQTQAEHTGGVQAPGAVAQRHPGQAPGGLGLGHGRPMGRQQSPFIQTGLGAQQFHQAPRRPATARQLGVQGGVARGPGTGGSRAGIGTPHPGQVGQFRRMGSAKTAMGRPLTPCRGRRGQGGPGRF